MAGCAVILNRYKHNREQGHKDNTNTPMGVDARASTQEQSCKTVRSCVKVRRAITYIRMRDKLRDQPGLKDRQAYRNSKGSKQPKARQTGPPPHCVYHWMPQEQAVVTTSQSNRQSPGSARREP